MQANMAASAASAATQVVNTPVTTGGVGGVLNSQKDASESSTAPKFGELLQNIQAKYGAKAEKPREIKKTLGKDDFLKIMITQMRHQDPTNPFKAEQMATEMAQFTSVEQMQNMNQNLQKMANQNQPLERLAMTGLIGKVVTVDRDRFAHVEGQNESLSFNLTKPASQVHLALISEAGEVIFEKDIGAQKQGENTFAWDGVRGNTLPAKSGNYMMRVEAKDQNGASIQSEPKRKVRVVGVSFEGGDPILLVGDNRQQDKVAMKSVIKIESDLQAAPLASSENSPAKSAAPIASAPIPEETKTPNFISFQKGVGSSTINTTATGGDVAQALSKFQAGAQPPRAEGFPNGLHDTDERR